jgi:hypothetical protein
MICHFLGLKITTDDDPAENKEDSFDNEWYMI